MSANDLAACRVLVVDDVLTNHEVLAAALGKLYTLYSAMDAQEALRVVAEIRPDLILLDIRMPGMSGYELCERLKQSPDTADVPIIFLTALAESKDKTRGFKSGAVDYIIKPIDIAEVRERTRTHLALRVARKQLKEQNDLLDARVRERTSELEITRDVMLESLAALTEYRDPETGMHIQRTREYVRVLAIDLAKRDRFRAELTEEMISLITKSAPLHDIGKVGVPDEILLKPGKLTDAEFEVMKNHTVYGSRTFERAERRIGTNSFLRISREIAHTHHERWDGSGYPRGLVGEQIPIAGRLMALADVYDALTSARAYKKPFTHEQAAKIILEGDGRTSPSHFDPEVLASFARQLDTFRAIAEDLADRDDDT